MRLTRTTPGTDCKVHPGPGHIFISRVSILVADGGSQEILLVISIIPPHSLDSRKPPVRTFCFCRVQDKFKPSTGHCHCLFSI